MTDIAELVQRLRLKHEALQKGWTFSSCRELQEAADALEAQAKRIAELEAAIPVIGHRGYLAGFGKAIEMAAKVADDNYPTAKSYLIAAIKALKPPQEESKC